VKAQFAAAFGISGCLVAASLSAQPAPLDEAASPPAVPATPELPATPATPATAPPAAPTTAPATPPAAGDVSVLPEGDPDDAFVADPASGGMLVGEDTPKLELYGFADVSYFHPLGRSENILRQYLAQNPTFFVGHLNLYLASAQPGRGALRL
jgi:hypothetical protein